MSVRRIVIASLVTVLALAATAAGVVAQLVDKADPKKAEAGELEYNNFCQTCHGDNLISSGQTFDLRRLQPADRKRYETSVQNGKGQMPPWKGVVSDEQMDVIWHYIMSRRN